VVAGDFDADEEESDFDESLEALDFSEDDELDVSLEPELSELDDGLEELLPELLEASLLDASRLSLR
jgi:hypothetical protein